MKRREFITPLGGAAATALTCPRIARSQDRVRRIAVIIGSAENDPSVLPRVVAWRQGLRDLGWIEGRNLHIEERWTGSDLQRARTLAAEVVALKPDLILAHSPPITAALRQMTQAIPIVFVQVTDPVGTGLVASLARPGGNITGFTTFEFAMGSKWLDLLKEIAPFVTRVAVMQFAKSPTWPGQLRAVQEQAQSVGVEIVPAGVESPADIERETSEFARVSNTGLIVMPDSLTLIHRKRIVTLAERYRIPAIYPFRYFVDDGGLISYGIDLIEVWRRSATYIDRILRGSVPADLPVQQPTKFELVINFKTAKALGLEVPPTLFARADEVIE
jgi:putative ABC transport system substrate-binding protein